MATFSFADLQASFPVLYRELKPQIQRKAVSLRLFPIRPTTTGQYVSFDVTFDGQAAAAVNADGGSFVTATADPRVPFQLSHGQYSAPISVTKKAQYVSANYGIDWMLNQFAVNIKEATEKLVKKLNQDIYSGLGTSNSMTGIQNAILATGTYGAINQSTYSSWAATVSSNAGSLRSLTLAMIKTMASNIAKVSPYGRPDIALCPPDIFNAVEALFDSNSRFVFPQPVGSGGALDMSLPQKFQMNPGTIYTAGGQIQRTGFRALHWENQGLTFIEDPDVTNPLQTNAANVMYVLNSNAVGFEYLPPPGAPRLMLEDRTVEAVEQDLGPLAGLPFELITEGRTAFADKADLLSICTPVINSRAACGLIADIQ